jgi:hypothetical protein
MIKVFTAGGRDASRLGGSWAGLIAILAFYLSLQGYSQSRAQTAAPTKGAEKQAETKGTEKKAGEKKAAGEAEKKEEADEDEAKADVDPSESQKGVSLEIFLDPNAEALVDLKKFTEIRAGKDATPAEFTQFKQMPGDPLVPVNPTVITAVVDSMIAKLTNHKNIEAVAAEQSPGGGAAAPGSASRAIQEATQTLLEPIFLARSAKNVQFQTQYNRILAQRLEPVLKNHLIPRIQAMIVLGQSANLDAYKIFLNEIKNPAQTVWVKLWAFRGLTNIKQYTNKLTASQEIDAAKVVSDELAKNLEWPWPVQLRGLETLAALRQGYLPTSPRTADMAATAFQYIVKADLHPEVRAEAALALGSMQLNPVVPKYNVVVAAHASARLAADIGDEIGNGFSENKIRAQKLTTTLMGPVLQAFEGRAGLRESGFLNSPLLSNKADVQKYIDAIRPVAKSAIELVGGPTGQMAARTADLKKNVAALKSFLAKNEPTNRELFQGGPQLPAAGGEVAQEKAAPAATKEKEKEKEKEKPKEKGAPAQANADPAKGRGKQ